MQTYTAVAWLPGSAFFVVQDKAGKYYWLTPTDLEEKGEWFYHSAVQKHWYKPIEPTPVTQDTATAVDKQLEVKYYPNGSEDHYR